MVPENIYTTTAVSFHGTEGTGIWEKQFIILAEPSGINAKVISLATRSSGTDSATPPRHLANGTAT